MKNSCSLLCLLILSCCNFVLAQKKIIKATSEWVDIREGATLNKKAWKITPQLNPDIYKTSLKGKRITFITDRDSVSVKITPTTKYDFTILLNDSIRAETEIVYDPPYLDKLVFGKEYDTNDRRHIPQFEYQDKSDSNLQHLRHYFNLDSIAGGGHQMKKVINLMYWTQSCPS